MILFLVTALALLGLLVGIPIWTGTEYEQMPLGVVLALAVCVVLSAIFGRTPKDKD